MPWKLPSATMADALEPAWWACGLEFLLFQLIGASALGYTSSSDTSRRTAASLCVVLICTHLQWGVKSIHYPAERRDFIDGLQTVSIFQEFHLVELLLFSRASYMDEIQRRKKKESDDDDGGDVGSPIRWSLSLMWNPRRIGTRWQVKNIPCFLSSSASWVPSRSVFVCMRLTTISLIAAGIYALKIYSAHSHGLSDWLDPDHERLVGQLGGLTLNSVLMRMIGVVASYCLIYFTGVMCVNAVSVLIVSLGLSDAAAWPPILGPVGTAWSIRQFWGVTWHQLLRRPFTAYSNFVAFSVLHLPPGTLLIRYARLFLVFGISGLLHSAADMLQGSSGSPGLVVFLLQAAGITFEDGVQAAYAWVSPPQARRQEKDGDGDQPRSLATAIIGYAWTLAFLAWSSAPWIFPSARNLLDQMGLG